MVIISKYRVERKEEIFVISEESSLCPECGSSLCKRDRRKRVYKEEGGKKSWYSIRRLKCTNEKCGRLHNELPDCFVPFKHYSSKIIENVVDEAVGPDDLETEDYPCEGTMNHWKWWMLHNEANINGQMRSVLHHLADLDTEFLKSCDSILEGLKERITNGWLGIVVRFIYNSGGRIEPYPEV